MSEGGTLIVLDEIQACPKALTSLKYFCEDASGYAVAAAGSLLGITVHEGSGYPVGKVNTLDLHPLSFREFLVATGNRPLCDLIDTGDTSLINGFSSKFVPLLRQYYYVGGMPEAVSVFLERGLLEDARDAQLEILRGYERDISKHLSRTETEYALAAWRSIPSHLGRENKKFVFSHIASGARARNYQTGITWLTQAGITTLVAGSRSRASPWRPTPTTLRSNFSWWMSACLGRWRSWTRRRSSGATISSRNSRASLTEQYVCQQLVSDCGLTPYYWSAENSSGEIDFLVQGLNSVYAIEVKAEENLRAKSLRAFKESHPEIKSVRLSLSGYREQDWMRNVPLYAMSNMGLWG